MTKPSNAKMAAAYVKKGQEHFLEENKPEWREIAEAISKRLGIPFNEARQYLFMKTASQVLLLSNYEVLPADIESLDSMQGVRR